MKIFDFNIHLPSVTSSNVNDVIADDLSLDPNGLLKGFQKYQASTSNAAAANVLLFNQRLFERDDALHGVASTIRSHFEKSLFTALVDFRRKDAIPYLERAVASGVNAFMFNSYLQQIQPTDFEAVLRVCRFAEKHNRVICIDGSYGTSKMYAYDNMLLACYVADHVSNVPVVIIHSGGYRVLEAMLLALDKQNVILDTSFSLNYYLGSSLEKDYAFAYKRMGAERVVFGTDVPYVDFDTAINAQLDFFRKHDFSDREIELIFWTNAVRLADTHGA